MVKEIPRKERPKSVYDNVQYSPNKPPSWQYYRCMAIVIKVFELIFSGLVFLFACIWVQNLDKAVLRTSPFIIDNTGAAVWVLFAALVAITVTVILFLCLICCVIWIVKKASKWFCFEFFLHILMIVLWFITSMVAIVFAVINPEYYIICACVFSFFAQLMYSVDCNMQFVYWRESKRRDIYKHSQPVPVLYSDN